MSSIISPTEFSFLKGAPHSSSGPSARGRISSLSVEGRDGAVSEHETLKKVNCLFSEIKRTSAFQEATKPFSGREITLRFNTSAPGFTVAGSDKIYTFFNLAAGSTNPTESALIQKNAAAIQKLALEFQKAPPSSPHGGESPRHPVAHHGGGSPGSHRKRASAHLVATPLDHTAYTDQIASLRQQLAINTSSLETATTQAATLTQQLSAATDNLAQLETAHQALQNTLTTAQATIAENAVILARVKSELSTSQDQLAALRATHEETQAALTAAQQDVTRLRGEAGTSQTSLTTAQERVQALETERAQQQAQIVQLNQQVETLTATNSTLTTANTQFEATIAEHLATIQQLTTTCTANTVTLTQTQEHLTAAHATNAAQTTQIEQLTTTLQLITEANTTLTEQIATLRAQLSTATTEKKGAISHVSAELSAVQGQIAQHIAENAQLKSALTKSQDKLGVALSENERLKSQLIAATNASEGLQRELAALRSAQSQLQNDTATSRAELVAAKATYEKEKDSGRATQAELVEIHAKATALKSEYKGYRDQLADKNQKITALNAQLEEMTDVIYRLREDNSSLRGRFSELEGLLAKQAEHVTRTSRRALQKTSLTVTATSDAGAPSGGVEHAQNHELRILAENLRSLLEEASRARHYPVFEDLASYQNFVIQQMIATGNITFTHDSTKKTTTFNFTDIAKTFLFKDSAEPKASSLRYKNTGAKKFASTDKTNLTKFKNLYASNLHSEFLKISIRTAKAALGTSIESFMNHCNTLAVQLQKNKTEHERHIKRLETLTSSPVKLEESEEASKQSEITSLLKIINDLPTPSQTVTEFVRFNFAIRDLHLIKALLPNNSSIISLIGTFSTLLEKVAPIFDATSSSASDAVAGSE